MLSATPPPDIPDAALFPGADRDAALDHPELTRRINASKPAELVLVRAGRLPEKDAFVEAAVERAAAFVKQEDRRRVAVIVNRVRTADSIARSLREQCGGEIDVVLLTGQLRPFERDQLVTRWKPVLKASKPDEPEVPVVLVTTQCIEVGADFSFDALVTEAASLDGDRSKFRVFALHRHAKPAFLGGQERDGCYVEKGGEPLCLVKSARGREAEER